MTIAIRAEWDTTLESFLAERIYEFNSRTTGIHDAAAVTASVEDESGRVIAAVTGHTWGGTCQVTYLWVDETHRRRGLGRALLRAVEVEARRRRCAQVVLFTHSFQAPGFYEKHGYARNAAVDGYPAGHSQLLYVKHLGAEGTTRGGGGDEPEVIAC
jgi:ribosomal protein S18 acetylase RimI-like enzyme